jgi:NAD+ diphosphatase
MTANSNKDSVGTSGLPFNSTILGADFTLLKPGFASSDLPGCWALLQGNCLVLQESGGAFELPEGEQPGWSNRAEEPVCVGLWHGRLLRALEVDVRTVITSPYAAVPFHGTDAKLDGRLSTLAGMASQILYWERRSRFCSSCSAELEIISGTWGKRCPSCLAEHFPHIHPCVIVLVKKGDNFLLERKVEWSSGRYSLIAGFLEFGESLEECVQREVREESGIEVTNIRYLGSQNWPFPSQQMIGFLADYAGGEARGDGLEIIESRWFTGDCIPCFPGSSLSISRWILDSFGPSLGGDKIN